MASLTEGKKMTAQQTIEKLTGRSVSFKSGASNITATITGGKLWEKGDFSRIYWDVEIQGDERKAFRGLFTVIEGGKGRYVDQHLTTETGTHVYDRGVFAHSGAKEYAIQEAITELMA